MGIDIGKNLHVASLLDERKKIIFRGFEFKNTTDDAKRLLEKLNPYPELEIGMEATVHYRLALYSFLVKNHLVVHVV